MRFPKIYTFLKWLGPSFVAFIGGIITLLAILSQSFSGIKYWVEQQFAIWWPILSSQWFIAGCCLIATVYIGLLIYVGGRKKVDGSSVLNSSTPPPNPNSEKYDNVKRQPTSVKAGGVSVTSINQSGGQTAHTIHNREPDPVPARKLSSDQANAIRKVLDSSDIKGEILEIQFASSEHARFSAQISSIFQKCGWKRQTMCIPSREKPHGMQVAFKGKKSDAYLLAVKALTAAGFEFTEGEYDGYEADISLDVGILEMTAFQRAADRWPE